MGTYRIIDKIFDGLFATLSFLEVCFMVMETALMLAAILFTAAAPFIIMWLVLR